MSDAIEQKVISMLDALQSGIAEVGGQVVKYTPDVIDATLWVVRIDVISAIFSSLVVFLVTALLSKKFYNELQNTEYDVDKRVFCVIGLIGSSISALISFLCLADIWNFVALIEPKLYIAKQIIEATLTK